MGPCDILRSPEASIILEVRNVQYNEQIILGLLRKFGVLAAG